VERPGTTPPHDGDVDDEEDEGSVATAGFRPVEGSGDQQPLSRLGNVATQPLLPAPLASPSRDVNPFEVLRLASLEGEASLGPQAPSLRAMVDAGFDEMFSNAEDRDGDNAPF
jgi:hypothetical protein